MNITLEKQPKRRGSKETMIVVKANGRYIGYIRKFDNTFHDKFPWQAFAPPAGNRTPNRLLGTFYKADGYKDAALAAVTDNNGVP